MKYRYYCSIYIFLLVCLLFCCTPPAELNSPAEPPSDELLIPAEPTQPDIPIELPSGELSIVQIYGIIKDCDYWYYAWDGSVKAFKGDEEISLQGERRICDVQFVDGWIYYVKAHDRVGFDICRIRPNGEDFSVFFNSDEFEDTEHTFASFNSLVFVDGYIYIQASLLLYKYDMLTKTVKQIGDVSIYHIADNRLYSIGYVSREFTIYVMDLETEETEILLGDWVYGRDKEYPKLLYNDFIFIGDIMYYTRRFVRSDSEYYFTELFRYENGESTLIDITDDFREFTLFEYNGKLYYFKRDGEIGKLMQHNPKDETITEILTCSNFKSGGKIINGYFYYLDSAGDIQQVKM
jgi:hypothetical protein